MKITAEPRSDQWNADLISLPMWAIYKAEELLGINSDIEMSI